MEELLARLATFCEDREIHRFSPEEMQQLLEDGETVEWIVGQVLPEGPDEVARELGQVLGELAAQVNPVPAGSEPEAAPEPVEAIPELDWQELVQGMGLPPGVGVEQIRALMSSPQGALLADFSAFCEERGLSAETDQEEMSEAMQQLQEEWLQTPREALEGRRPAEVLEGGRLFPAKVETFRREGPKVGRNDPCPCGSGRKYKKCCGKGE